jgi:protein-tyrosine-phosphatase
MRSLLPKQLLELMRQLRVLNWDERRLLLSLRLQRWRGARRDELAEMSGAQRRVLFVCHGNIIRSPMCEVLLRDIARHAGDAGLTIESAGLHANPGKSADPRARTAAADFGVSLDSHRARRLVIEAVDRADIIFVMDWLDEARLISRYPNSQSKVLLLGAFGREDARTEPIVPDPYSEGADAVAACYRRLNVAVRAVASKIVRSPENQAKGVLVSGTER